MASPEERLLDELNNVIVSFLCDSGSLEVERCSGAHVFSRGSSQPLCTVKLRHGQIYHLEFVYKFLAFKLKNCNYPSSPVFVISNNGLATTLRCFLHEPSGLRSGQAGPCLGLATDVDLPKNSIILLGQDDFIKFKSPLVFPAELDLLKSMVVCRAYITEHRTTMQFLVFQAANAQKASRVMDMISDMSQQLALTRQGEEPGVRAAGGGEPRTASGGSLSRGRGGWAVGDFSDAETDDDRSRAPWRDEDWSGSEAASWKKELVRRPIRGHWTRVARRKRSRHSRAEHVPPEDPATETAGAWRPPLFRTPPYLAQALAVAAVALSLLFLRWA
ncbi:BFRF1 [macacine gammaherpesvirus 10]|uniref:BFRF1 n=1 Tax=macacine gammaherpesvirus 10 TaxID=2560569 RepID=A0A0S0DXG3_9GAMA|nr:BFRF1 [macacine gammaherpesvirus 10]ALF03215.1 BFRF1 [macacine gammaherpesvirus 10]